MKNKRYIRLSKKMKSHCTGNCNGGKKQNVNITKLVLVQDI